jgi:hypothetical protein
VAKVQCPACDHNFEGSPLKNAAGLIAGATVGGYFGGGLGIAAGPLGAIAGTLPGMLVGGTIGYLGSHKFYRCPKCRDTFSL